MTSSPLRHLYPRLTSFASLHAAARRAQRGKRYRPAVLAFNAQLGTELLRLQEELRSFTYRPGPYRQFRIRDPKPRLISAAPYRDRVVHHALCAAIVPPIERGFHRGSHANRLGYGSHRALRRFVAAGRRHGWLLQADIRLYFPSIDLTILRAQLAERIACPGTLWLLEQILANGATADAAGRPKGLPIGNLTSQFLANLYLDQLDHRLSALPGIRVYLRYVDDLALFADRPEPLQRARLILETELSALRLRLHPIKTQIRRCRDGASFVGFQVLPCRVRVRNHNLRKGLRRLRTHHRAVVAGLLAPEQARRSLQSWNAHLAHGHTWRLRQRLFAPLPYAEGLP
ncbi:MAG: reverse transcriptase domain-containing protein [Synechococcaceae cyanobacterium]|jgi:RNA-directed DNA polymerase